MSLLASGWLFVGAGAAVALVALHLLALGRPAPLVLPTTRFVPARAVRARRLARRPTDLLLLATRAASEYVYVGADLRKIAVVAAALFGVMLVLWVLLVIVGVAGSY